MGDRNGILTVQTVFTAPTACATTGITQGVQNGGLWNNLIVPAPNVTVTSCLPSQFVESAVATTSLPPFEQLICPSGWGTYHFNSTYIACCPSGYGVYAPNSTDVQRPATSAFCTSIIWPSVLYDVTRYGSSNLAAPTNVTVEGLTAGSEGVLFFVTIFDGTAASTTLTVAPSTTATTSTATKTSSSSYQTFTQSSG